MPMFCKHQWSVVARTYAPPRVITGGVEMSEYLAERLLFGVTTVLLQCDRCKATRKEEMVGKETHDTHGIPQEPAR